MTKVDSAGIGSLVVADTAVVKQGGRLVIVLPEGYFKSSMLGIASRVEVFKVYQTREL